VIPVKILGLKFRPYTGRIKTLDWMTYTLNSGNETRVAEIANACWNETDKVGNPISKRSIHLKMTVLC
jgi:hypothetical protein